jgi:hypothetical protein
MTQRKNVPKKEEEEGGGPPTRRFAQVEDIAGHP